LPAGEHRSSGRNGRATLAHARQCGRVGGAPLLLDRKGRTTLAHAGGSAAWLCQPPSSLTRGGGVARHGPRGGVALSQAPMLRRRLAHARRWCGCGLALGREPAAGTVLDRGEGDCISRRLMQLNGSEVCHGCANGRGSLVQSGRALWWARRLTPSNGHCSNRVDRLRSVSLCAFERGALPPPPAACGGGCRWGLTPSNGRIRLSAPSLLRGGGRCGAVCGSTLTAPGNRTRTSRCLLRGGG